MLLDVLRMALELLAVNQGLHLALNRLVADLAVRGSGPVAVRVDALLHCIAVLPHLVALRYLGQAQAMREDGLGVRAVGQSISEADDHAGALFRKPVHAHFLAAVGQRQRHA